MALNKNALIRYKTIDKCLQNEYREWTLNDLIEACSDALYDYEGRNTNVSRRTIQLDIQLMRSDKLGYNAPIVVYKKKFYKYEVSGFSITDIPLTENDMNVLSETVEMLKQFKDFSLFSELGDIIHRLEDKIYSEKTHQNTIIHLDKNKNLKGLEHLDVLYQAILKKMVLEIEYKSFRAQESSLISFEPLILKEYNNRWFLVGRKHNSDRIDTLALDRILTIDYNLDLEYTSVDFDGDLHYKNTIGVTVLPKKYVADVVLKIDRSNAPYVITKPFHHSQRVIENGKYNTTISIRVHLNLELERLILGFRNSIEVIAPKQLRERIFSKLEKATELYGC